MRSSTRLLALLTIVSCCLPCFQNARAQGPLDEDGKLVRFQRDIAPILRDHCLECHGPEKQEADFRVDEPDSLFMYVEPEDLESSVLFIDYLTAEDSDMLMPPPGSGGPLSVHQLALMRVWIEEGAEWPEGATVQPVEEADAETVVEEPRTPQSFLARFWAFQGFLHPATVHFPIALLLMGGAFVVLGWKWPPLGAQIPFACLVIGAASSVAATAMGWSFAEQRGHGGVFDPSKEIFWHRWSAVLATVLAVILAGIALAAARRGSVRLQKVWRAGLVVVAVMVGLVGHQGGELTYGDTFYQRAFEMLRGPQTSVEAETADKISQAEAAADDLAQTP